MPARSPVLWLGSQAAIYCNQPYRLASRWSVIALHVVAQDMHCDHVADAILATHAQWDGVIYGWHVAVRSFGFTGLEHSFAAPRADTALRAD